MNQHSVLCEKVVTSSGAAIGHISLNKPEALNAIDSSMVNRIDSQLAEWADDTDVVCILLDSAGEKAFCAGGDVVSMYQAMEQEPGKTPQFITSFFTREYQLDYRIHTYAKPIIVWGQGIVMGGGLGLFNGASHRVVTATSRIAMPEITIGLYPDVGGSWFLNRMPGKCGLFVGLTGASINAADALYTGLADFYTGIHSSRECLDELTKQNWPTGTMNAELRRELHQRVSDVLMAFDNTSKTTLPSGHIQALQLEIDKACSAPSLPQIVTNIAAMPSDSDKWLSKAQRGLSSGSAITATIIYQQLRNGESMTLAECFQMELDMSCRCAEFGEFAEGVRALLIDKDMRPKWRYASTERVPQSVTDWFFTSPWDAENHPLALLGVE